MLYFASEIPQDTTQMLCFWNLVFRVDFPPPCPFQAPSSLQYVAAVLLEIYCPSPFRYFSVISHINKLYPFLCKQKALPFQMPAQHPKSPLNLWWTVIKKSQPPPPPKITPKQTYMEVQPSKAGSRLPFSYEMALTVCHTLLHCKGHPMGRGRPR